MSNRCCCYTMKYFIVIQKVQETTQLTHKLPFLTLICLTLGTPINLCVSSMNHPVSPNFVSEIKNLH